MCVLTVILPPDTNECSVHLVNRGVSVSGTNATVEWQGTGPSRYRRVMKFNCRLDNTPASPCEYVAET